MSEQRLITKVKREIIRYYGSSKGTPKEAEYAAKRILELLKPHLRVPFPREAMTSVIKDLIKCVLENAEHMKSEKVMDTLLSVDIIQNIGEKTIIIIENLFNSENARPEPAHPNGSNCPNPNNEGLCGCKPVCTEKDWRSRTIVGSLKAMRPQE